jgi:hypothetical protein
VTRATKEANTRKSAPPATGKTGYGALIAVSIQSSGYGAKIAIGAAQNHPKSPPDSSGSLNNEYIALRGLISETNVFNLINQKR